jgi:hypothetical protein
MAVSMAARRLPDKAKRDPALNAALNACRRKLLMMNV